ncbi:uncharacterized protein LOC135689929 [Rhopilema esculentum]|uniref:uncharacterized protein LOC135689929 n=1 Tax=Rhopilema esculentum TaxID=499914 RepID=UPI0031D13B42|eukprot:gene8214-14151_t
MDHIEKASRNKGLSKKRFEREIFELSAKIKDIEEKLKSLNPKIPDKSHYAALRSEHQGKLSDVKAQRDSQFKEKRIVDAQLREVNQEVQTKNDAIGKLKSNLKYKNVEKVDNVIRRLEAQLQRMQMKASEERRMRQEISDLQGSKTKIQDLKDLEGEVILLRAKQKDLRARRDENLQLITSIKREETEAKSVLEQHKKAEDEEWAIYKENLSRRDQLRNQRDSLLKRKRELTDQFRKNQSSLRDIWARKDLQWGHLLNDQDSKSKEQNPMQGLQIVTERKKPFEDDIMHCNVLLSFLEKYETQTDGKEFEGSEQKTAQEVSSEPKDDIYQGVKRRPSKRERRRKQHFAEASKKLELHVSVLERFVSLGIQPPASLVDLPRAKSAIEEKKKYFMEKQLYITKQSSIKRAKSNPFIVPMSNTDNLLTTNNIGLDMEAGTNGPEEENQRKNSFFYNRRRHKSCPSLHKTVDESSDKDAQFLRNETSDRDSTQSISGSNSEYEPESPRSTTSSSSFGKFRSSYDDLKAATSELPTGFIESRSPDSEEKLQFYYDDEREAKDSRFDDSRKSSKFQLKVHFANDIREVLDDANVLHGGSMEYGHERGAKNKQRTGNEHGAGDEVESGSVLNSENLHSDQSKGLKMGVNGKEVPVEQKEAIVGQSSVGIPIHMNKPFSNHGWQDEDLAVESQFRRLHRVESGQHYSSGDDEYNDSKGFTDASELQFSMDDSPSNSCVEQQSTAQNIKSGGISSTRFSHQVTDALPSQPRSTGGCSPRRSMGCLDKNDESVEVTT